MMLIRAYTTHGHLKADVDPLKLFESYKHFPTYAEKFKIAQASSSNLLDYKAYGFTEADLDREFYVDAPELSGLMSRKRIGSSENLLSLTKRLTATRLV